MAGYTEVQTAWQALTFVDFGQASVGQDGRAGGGTRLTAPAWGLAQFGREALPVGAAGGYKTVAGV